MLNIVNRAGTLTFEIKNSDVQLAISCNCIKDEYMYLIIEEFQKTKDSSRFIKQGGSNEMEGTV
jgi:hypothetical protein